MIAKDTPYTDDLLIHQIYKTMRMFTNTLNEMLRTYGLYSAEWTVLNFLKKHDGSLQSDIAAALQIEAAAISKTLGKMEKKHLITRTVRKDKREKYIFLTPNAKNIFPALSQAVTLHRNQALSDLSEADRKKMLSFIVSMSQQLTGSESH
jgi:MarR family transcriptional regulator for hemolysin